MSVAENFRIHTFISTSDVHVQSKLKRSQSEVQEMAVRAIKFARRFTDDVEFSCEDAGRTPIDYLCRMVETAIAAGATTINIPDTVGYTLPSEFGGIIQTLYNRVPNIDKAVISVHCHNDLGLAVANSLAAVQAGAGQVECTINGIGERAGNCSLEEIAMIINTREAILNKHTGINTQEISRTSRLVSQLCNMPVQANKAIVGANAFSHSSGIHQDGVLKSKNTYEIITPETVGLSTNTLNLTSRSGRHVIKHRMNSMGYQESDYDLDSLYESFLTLADKKGKVFDHDLEALLFFNQIQDMDEHFKLEYLSVQAGTNLVATASVKLHADDKTHTEAATGNGPVDAVYQAIKKITGYDLEISSYQIGSKGEGENALGQVDIIARYKEQNFHGMGLATDIITSSAHALLHAVNGIYRAEQVAAHKQDIQQKAG